ncbi:MAG: Asp-tRNA(Asn)/Glu-tRNA(Gln) amidotransferase subunit GatB [Patescibacteria group bacterium]|nr:Asp-tRNA(Asn)/Glu-tRNA(Gln) amidotransferase subunit GatB [Patescibacteria group bacterium]
MPNKFETIIGLEIHLQLKTKSKMFCACANDAQNQAPNTLVCPICLGHPGTLPALNKEAVKMGLMMALALNCQIRKKSKFDRKNYFYPDLPKGYQISQFDEPLADEGFFVIERENGDNWSLGIERLHLEEDAAKNIHEKEETFVDFNRGGVPLAEIVTKPDIRRPEDARLFLEQLRLTARYLGVSDADMEKGQLRCDANISLRPLSDTKLYPKTEIKNLNSFKAVQRALEFEEKRQTKLWQEKKAPKKTETRGWDEDKKQTVAQRSKEGSSDYRYFPEPDLPPLLISDEFLQRTKNQLGELPLVKKERFIREYGLSAKDAWVLIRQKDWANYYEGVMSDLRAWLFKAKGAYPESDQAAKLWQEHKKKLAKLAYNWISSELFSLLGAHFKMEKLKISAENMAELVYLVYEKKINSSAGQIILKEMFQGTDDDPSRVAERLDLAQIEDDTTLEGIVMRVLVLFPDQAEQYRQGKTAVLQFLVGQVMKESKGKANPKKIEEILKKKLK